MLKKVFFILMVVKLFPHRYYLSVPPCLRLRLSQMFELLGIGSFCYAHRQARDFCAVKKLGANFFRPSLVMTMSGSKDSIRAAVGLVSQQISTPLADINPLRRFGSPYQTFLLIIICIIIGNQFYLQAFSRCYFNYNTTFLNRGKEKQPFRSCLIYYSESYSIRTN